MSISCVESCVSVWSNKFSLSQHSVDDRVLSLALPHVRCVLHTGGTMDSISRIWANRRRKIQNPKSKIAKIDRRGGPRTSRNRHQHAPRRRPTACLDDDSNWAWSDLSSKRREFQCGSASSLPTQRHVRTACPFLWALREGVSASSAATTSNR